jgi:multidrug/hemolysin transport system permease protein
VREIWFFVRRNLRVFWRDKLSVFFSVMGPLILFILFTLFFRKGNANAILGVIPNGVEADAYAMADEWLFASVTTFATFTSSLGLLNGFVDDRVSGRFSDYLVTPMRRWQLAVSYVLSTLIVSFIISVVFMAAGQGWAAVLDQPFLSWRQALACAGGIFMSCLVFSALNTLVVTFTTSTSSFGGYSIIMGTAMGFLSFCYVPPSGLGKTMNSVLSALPFAQGAALVRRPAMDPAIALVTNPLVGDLRDQAKDRLMNDLAAQLWVNDHLLSQWFMVAVLAGLTVVLALATSWRLGRVIR